MALLATVSQKPVSLLQSAAREIGFMVCLKLFKIAHFPCSKIFHNICSSNYIGIKLQ